MPSPLYRVFVSLVLAPFVALSATIAPEHLHESDAGHPHAVAHRHLEPHHLALHDHDAAELDHSDGEIVWLHDVGACQPTYELPVPDARVSERFDMVPAVSQWIATSINDAAPAHGPPRLPQSLRAPPSPAL